MSELPWYENPERGCAGDERFADIKGVNRAEREEMKQICASCPVQAECLADLLRFPDYEHYGIRAGIEGKT